MPMSSVQDTNPSRKQVNIQKITGQKTAYEEGKTPLENNKPHVTEHNKTKIQVWEANEKTSIK